MTKLDKLMSDELLTRATEWLRQYQMYPWQNVNAFGAPELIRDLTAEVQRLQAENAELRADKAFWSTMTHTERAEDAEAEVVRLRTQLDEKDKGLGATIDYLRADATEKHQSLQQLTSALTQLAAQWREAAAAFLAVNSRVSDIGCCYQGIEAAAFDISKLLKAHDLRHTSPAPATP